MSDLKPGCPIRYFGDYLIQGELARGGMGVVYQARQVSLNRLVALKTIHSDKLAGAQSRERFRREAEAAASLDHPNIVPIYEIGEHEGELYFSMKLLPEGSLADALKEKQWQLPEPKLRAVVRREAQHRAAALVATMARALQHAHAHGVLHRDLKPGNILLDEAGEPHLTDFGLAKLLDRESPAAQTRAALGTPEYMAPEQAIGRPNQVTTATDVYGLGAVLYELLTGRPPFVGADNVAVLLQVVQNEPERPGKLSPGINLDLETICLRCLAKEPARRYRSAAALAEDLDRWLESKPILARRVSYAERLWLWARRKPAVALATSFAFVALVSVLGAILWIKTAQRSQLEAAYQATRDANTLLRRRSAEQFFGGGRAQDAIASLAGAIRSDRSNSPAAARLVSALSRRTFPGPAAPSLEDDSSIIFACYTPDGQRVVTLSLENQLRLWNPATGLPLSPPLQHPDGINGLDFTAGSEDILSLVPDDALYLWNGHNGTLIARFQLASGLCCAAAHPSNQVVVAAFTNGHVIAFDPRAPERRREWAAHPDPVGWLEFSRDGRFLVTSSTSTNSGVKVWSGQEPFPLLAELAHSTNSVPQARPSPDGSHLFTVDATGMAQFWKLPAGPLVGGTNLPSGSYQVAEFSPDSSRLLVGTTAGLVLVFDPRTGAELLRYTNHSQSVLSARINDLAVSPDNRRVLSGSQDNTVQLWDLETGKPLSEPIRHEFWATAVRFAPVGPELLSVEFGRSARLWKPLPAPATPLCIVEPEGIRTVAFANSGTQWELITVSTNGAIHVRDPHTGAFRRTLREPATPLEYADFVGDNRFLALADTHHSVTLVNPVTGASLRLETPHAGQVRWFDLSRDGRQLAIAADADIFVCDTSTGRLVAGPFHCQTKKPLFGHTLYRVRFSPDGTQLLSACHEQHGRLWDIASGRVLAEFPHRGGLSSAEFSPDGTAILTASFDNTAKLWALTNLAARPVVFRHVDQLCEARFSPDGRQVVAACFNGTAIVWDIATAAHLAEPLTHRLFVHGAEFDCSGTRILTRSWDGTFRLWQARTGLPLGEPFDVGAKPLAIAATPDWTTFAACTGGREVLVWEEPPLPLPVPDWLPELAEAIAGKRLNPDNAEQAVPAAALPALQARLSALSPTNAWNRWARWFVADPGQRSRTWPQ